MVTFGTLVRLEPRLLTLLQDAVLDGVHMDKQAASDAWANRYLPGITKLVGFAAENGHPVLNTSVAYDVAYNAIRDSLYAADNEV